MIIPVSADICDKKKTKSGRDDGGPVNAKNWGLKMTQNDIAYRIKIDICVASYINCIHVRTCSKVHV